MKYPLDDNFFRVPPLSPASRQSFLDQGDKILRTFLDKTLKRDESMRWSFVGEYDGVRLLEGDIPGLKLDKSITPFRAVTKIHATLEEIADMHACATRAQCKRFIRNYADDVLDLITLHNLVERSAAHPLKQMYVKWTVCESPVPIIKDRDFVYLESQDLFKLSSGRRGWALCQNSIELPYVQSLQKTPLQAVRGTLNHTGSVYIETDTPGVLDVIYHISTDMKGNIHHWVRKQAMKRRARHVAALNDFVHQARLASVALKSKAELYTPSSSATTMVVHNCSLCMRDLSRARFCQSCAEPVCSRCSRKWRLPNTPADQPSVRICNVCSSAVRSGRLTSDDGHSSAPSEVSSNGSDVKPRKHSSVASDVASVVSTIDAKGRKSSMPVEPTSGTTTVVAPRRRTVDPVEMTPTTTTKTTTKAKAPPSGPLRIDEDTMDLSYLKLYEAQGPAPIGNVHPRALMRPEPSTSSFVMMEPSVEFDDFDDDDASGVSTPGSRHGSMDFDDPAFAKFVDHITQAPMRQSLRLANELSR